MIKHFARDRSGNMMLAAGLTAIPLVLAVGLAVDVSNMSKTRTELHAALDAASMQIAYYASSGMTNSELQAFGNEVLLSNLGSDIAGSTNPPTLYYHGLVTDTDGTMSMSTSLTYNYETLIMGAAAGSVGTTTKTINIGAQISAREGDPACVYALSGTAPRAINVTGSTSVSMDGCVVASNSNDDESLYVGGSATMHADCAQASGGINATTGLTTDCAANRENTWSGPDPFADLVEPAAPALLTNPAKSDTTVSPGRYSDLKLDGTKTLDPGLYYIEGSLTVKGDITGSGVYFYMKDGGVTVNASASMILDAPTSGSYAGMLFFAPSTNTNDWKFNGNGTTELNGFIYHPGGHVEFSGSNSTTSTCLRIAADTIKLTGNSDMKADCSAELGGREAKIAGPVFFSN